MGRAVVYAIAIWSMARRKSPMLNADNGKNSGPTSRNTRPRSPSTFSLRSRLRSNSHGAHRGRTLCRTPATHGPHTMLQAMTKPQSANENRTIPPIFGNNRLDELLFQLLDDSDPRLRMYVYRMRDDEKIVPQFVGMPFSNSLRMASRRTWPAVPSTS